ncbi:hypothetical protein L210DRAFT_3765781 [Boletus edulis BED1]|uniref:Fungal-type protein kinase domain-containing protein n=1 Tax=Boletus edulis BED1 TaxID=1328754 RepID=A0AAD4BER9_BOLED|nr:hypothetical protein L210DRAFT_3765781 [Boletus edulis BED1]
MLSALAGCAVGHDGQLLDASQIQWFHDADDNTPLPQIPTLTSNAASSSSIKIRIPPPAARVAGQRRTERGLPAALRCLTERRNTICAGKRRASSAGLSSQDESVSRDCFRASDSNRDDRDVFPMDTDTNLSDGVAITNMTDDDHTSSQMSATALGDTDLQAIDEEDGNSSEPDRGCPQRFRYGVDPDDTRCAGTVPFMALQLLNKAAFQGNIPHVYEHDAESFIWILVWIALRYTNGNLKGDHDRPLNEWATVDPTRCREKKTDFLTNSEMRDRLQAGQGHEQN